MDLIGYLRVFKRRWLLLLVPVVGALVVSWATMPSQQAGQLVRSYTAKATLIASPAAVQDQQAPLSVQNAALFATVGEVPRHAAARLGYKGEPQVLASEMEVAPDPETGTLTISSTETKAATAKARSNAFAGATISYFRDQQQANARDRVRALNKQLDSTTAEIRQVQTELITSSKDPVLKARLDSLQARYTAQFTEIGDLNRELGAPGPVTLLQPGVAIPQADSGFVTPTNPLARLATALLLGLLLGGALALVIERFDSRLRTRDQVEESFGLPVLAEIPAIPLAERNRRDIASVVKPASATAEAYRGLRSAVLLLAPDNGGAGTPDRNNALVILVTSALPGEGKTTTVANLAAVMAEAGRKVITLSLDLRNPRLHEYLQVPDRTGISDLLTADRGEHLDQVIRDTCVKGVQIATSGQHLDHPGALLAGAGQSIMRARELADVVLIDTAPVLTVSDAVDLATFVDVAVIVSRLNKTTTTEASAAQRLLSRLGVPALGTVLVGSRAAGAHDGYRFYPWSGINGSRAVELLSGNGGPPPGGRDAPSQTGRDE